MAEDFARSLARAAVAQTAEAIGFDAVQQSAGDILSDLLLQYISEVGHATHSYAELAGRTDCNVNDLLLALEDVGASAEEIMDYTENMENLSFVHSVPSFPVAKKPAAFQSFAKKGEVPPQHIPAFLPAFPDKHTYMDTPVFTGHTKDARQQKLAQGKARRDAEKALLNLTARTQARAEEGQAKEGAKVVDNLFLAPPERIQLVERDPGAAQPMEIDSQERNQIPSGSWQEDVPLQPQSAQPGILPAPLKLDWSQPLPLRILTDPTDLGFEDAFANASEEVFETGGRRRRQSLKAKMAGDPATQRAEQLLAAGASAMNMEEAAPERSGR